MDLVIRPENSRDHAAIRGVNQAAFNGIAEAQLVDALRAGGFADISLVAELGDRVIGHILFSRVDITADERSIQALSLAPMAVLPEYQRQGIGGKLVEAGLRTCRELGHEVVVVLGRPAFYARWGFSAERAQNLMSPFGGGEAWMALELVPDVLHGVSGQITYAPPFSALEPESECSGDGDVVAGAGLSKTKESLGPERDVNLQRIRR